MSETRQVHVHWIHDDVARIRTHAPNSLPVNSFLIRQGRQHMLVDTGWHTGTDRLIDGLAEVGLRPDDIDQVLYTHTHEDHLGGGVVLGDQLGGEHILWAGVDFDNFYDHYESLPRWDQWYPQHIPPGRVLSALQAMSARRPRRSLRQGGDGSLPRGRRVALGETVVFGDTRWQCVDGRGHDPFHVAWYEPTRKWLLAGDVLLRVPTPILPPRGDDWLVYRNTLARWSRTLEVDWLLPGHGSPSTRFAMALKRSWGHLQQQFEATQAASVESRGIDLADVALTLAGGLKGSQLPRLFVMVSNVLGVLRALASYGAVRRRDDLLWERTGPWPDLVATLAQDVSTKHPQLG